MKKLLVIALTVGLVTVGGSAFAQGRVWDDLSWWGQSGATPAPYKEVVGPLCKNSEPRSGYWWWPTEPASNADDSELWGNRGVVYGMYAEETAAGPGTPPPPPEPVMVKRQVPVLNSVLFDFDKSVLKPEGKAECDKVVADLKQFPKDTLIVEGHTCNVGTDEYNMGLGQRRADAVKKYLVEQGLDTARVESKSFGESQPAVPNDTPANRKLNRRAVFNIVVNTMVEQK